jgi:hypothetical protein
VVVRQQTNDGMRSGAYSGVVFVALTVLWAVLLIVADRPGHNSSNDAISEFWGDSGNRTLVLLAAIALSLAGVALLWFLGSLRTILRRAEGEPARLATIAFAGGVVLATLMFVKNSIDGGLAIVLEFEADGFTLDPDSFRTFRAVFLGLLVHEGIAAGVLIGATSLLLLRTRVFPRWLAWSGLVVAVLALASWFVAGFPLLLVLAWVLTMSVLMLRSPEGGDSPALTDR